METQPPPVIDISSSQSALRVPRRRLRELVAFVADQQGQRLCHADIAVVGSEEMAGHNRAFLRHAGDTDVLSFDLSDASGLRVQLIVCAEVAVRQGPLHGLAPTHELMLYVIHGLLHVMGFEDKTVRGYVRMKARQEELLATFLKRARTRR